MSADGEIEIAVKAEGAEDAAAEVADAEPQPAAGDDGPGVPDAGGGGDEQGGGLSAGLGRAGGIGFIISKLLGPLLDVLSPIQKLLEAFLAPVAVLLLRLLQPALRLLIKILPVWFEIMGVLNDVVEWVQQVGREIWTRIGQWLAGLPGQIWNTATSVLQWLTNAPGAIASFIDTKLGGVLADIRDFVDNLAGDIWTKVQQLAAMTAEKLAEVLPGVDTPEVDTGMDTPTRGSGSRGVGQPDRPTAAELNTSRTQTRQQRPEVNVNLEGGLGAFVERIGRDENVDIL